MYSPSEAAGNVDQDPPREPISSAATTAAEVEDALPEVTVDEAERELDDGINHVGDLQDKRNTKFHVCLAISSVLGVLHQLDGPIFQKEECLHPIKDALVALRKMLAEALSQAIDEHQTAYEAVIPGLRMVTHHAALVVNARQQEKKNKEKKTKTQTSE